MTTVPADSAKTGVEQPSPPARAGAARIPPAAAEPAAILAGFAVAGGAAIAVAIGAGPAEGQTSAPIQTQLQVNSPGTLVAKGAGVNVSVTASCSGLNVPSASMGIGLTEALGKNLATGFGSATIDCTGTPWR
ncbi:MAG: hypothetical protein ACRDOK_23540 [Streptosporangiaceae bacterium]